MSNMTYIGHIISNNLITQLRFPKILIIFKIQPYNCMNTTVNQRVILLPYPQYSANNLQNKVLKYKPNCNHIKHLKSPDEMINLESTIVYLSLKNKDEFWFYIDSSRDDKLFGFRKLNYRWIYQVVELTEINSYF